MCLFCCVDIYSDGTKAMVGFTAGASAHTKAVSKAVALAVPAVAILVNKPTLSLTQKKPI